MCHGQITVRRGRGSSSNPGERGAEAVWVDGQAVSRAKAQTQLGRRWGDKSGGEGCKWLGEGLERSWDLGQDGAGRASKDGGLGAGACGWSSGVGRTQGGSWCLWGRSWGWSKGDSSKGGAAWVAETLGALRCHAPLQALRG